MAKGGKLATEAHNICQPLIEAMGIDLVDVDFIKEGKNQILRLYIDKRGGVGLDDCALVSRAVNDVLDSDFSWQGPYLLEVSSPGLDRPLKSQADFARHVGEEIDVRFYKAVDGKKDMQGLLTNANEENIELTITDASGKPTEQMYVLPLKECAKISRHIRF